MDENNGIGLNNKLPWKMPADLQYFKKMTLNKPILMGRKTHEAIGRALPKRRNIVVTRDPHYQSPGCDVFHSIEAALAELQHEPEVMVIGGQQIFTQMLPQADKLYVTIIQHSFDVDTYFPAIDLSEWHEENVIACKADEENPYNYQFITYSKTR